MTDGPKVRIHVKEKFGIVVDNGSGTPSLVEYEPGYHDVTLDVATHPYAITHMVDSSPPLPQEGTLEHALLLQQTMNAAKDRLRLAQDMVAEAEKAVEAAFKAAEHALSIRDQINGSAAKAATVEVPIEPKTRGRVKIKE